MVSVSFHVADRVLPNLNDRQKDLTDVFIHLLTQETIITMKHKIFLVATIMMALMAPQEASAYDFSAVAPTGQTLYYNIIDSTVSVTYPGSAYWMAYDENNYPTGSLEIPASVSYNGITYSVTAIGDHAFTGCSTLTSVIIPISVTSINSCSFCVCTGLTSIIIPNNVITIGNEAFAGCSGLTSLTLGNSVSTIGYQAFRECSNLMEIICMGQFAPTSVYGWGCDMFYGVPSSTPIYIPCGSWASYHGEWTCFNNFIEPDNPYSLDIYTFSETMGNASITTMPTCNNNDAVIEATPNYGYHFVQWIDGNTDNPRLITLSQDTSFTAQFAKNQYTVNVTPSHAERGSVAGDSTVDYLDSITLSAMANYGYHFDHWSDGSTLNPYTIAVTQNVTLTAYFVPNQYNLTVVSTDEARGNVSGGGNYEYLSNHTISATANYGYHFIQWNDGVATSSRNITLTQDTTFIAYFAPNQYNLTVTAGEHGTANGSGTYSYGDTITIQAYPDVHYHFIKWNDNNRDNPRQYRVVEDKTLIAIFAIDTHTVNVVSNDIVKGMVETNGTEFAYGSPCTVTATAYTGYTFAGWSNGVTANPYTFAVINDVELTALFVEEGEEVYTVTVESADTTMGTVSGGGQALIGGTLTIRAIPNEGYRFLHWNDDNTDNPRVVIVTENVTYTAYFEGTTQGIHKAENNTITIYPNPTNGIVKIASDDVTRIDVYNVNGQLVKSVSKYSVVDISNLPSGVYTLRVVTVQSTFVCRVIKQ